MPPQWRNVFSIGAPFLFFKFIKFAAQLEKKKKLSCLSILIRIPLDPKEILNDKKG